jgi:hypothetical protein
MLNDFEVLNSLTLRDTAMIVSCISSLDFVKSRMHQIIHDHCPPLRTWSVDCTLQDATKNWSDGTHQLFAFKQE